MFFWMPHDPNYEKTILCFANSRRPGGRCVAGKEFANGRLGGWIRPINAQNGSAISESDLQYENGKSADVLDVVTIPMLGARPQGHQTENHLIDPDCYWEKQARTTWAEIVAATDTVTGSLWPNGDSSYHGTNDKVAEALATRLTNSLLLIEPTRLELVVARESQYQGGSKRKVRANFDLNGARYNFVVTDPWIEAKYFARVDGNYPVEGSRLCISLAEAINGLAIKLVATVLTQDRTEASDG
jgi:hypothetical protein